MKLYSSLFAYLNNSKKKEKKLHTWTRSITFYKLTTAKWNILEASMARKSSDSNEENSDKGERNKHLLESAEEPPQSKEFKADKKAPTEKTATNAI